MEKESGGNSLGKVTGSMILRAAAIFFVFLLLPFPIAGDWSWPGAWANGLVMILFFSVSRLVAWRKDPELLAERGRLMDHKDMKPWDKVLSLIVGMAGYLAIIIVSALGRRFSWEPQVPGAGLLIGLGLGLLGNALSSWAFLANKFFSGVVRIQRERGHTVVDSGPYRIIRHPGYLGGVFGNLGAALLFGSYWALIPAACTIIAIIIRTYLEDSTLKEELPGYKEFTEKTRYRLIPGLW